VSPENKYDNMNLVASWGPEWQIACEHSV